MMYINIKKLYSWRIRPYKIPSFFFPLLFPFFSLFSSLFFFPPSSPLFPFFPPHGVRVCPSFGSGACTAASQQEGHGFDSCMGRCWLWGAGPPQTFSAQVGYLPGLSVWSLHFLPVFTRGFLQQKNMQKEQNTPVR